MTVIAHLTDIHLPPVPMPGLRELSLKRLLGFINWHRSRKFLHRSDVVDRVVRDLQRHSFDHLIVSGDLVNLALLEEFKAGAAWMAQFGSTVEVSFVPGNHDYYGSSDEFLAIASALVSSDDAACTPAPLSEYMQSDALGKEFGGGSGPLAPFIRVVGKAAIIGLNSAIPTPPFKAYGEIDQASLRFLADCLPALKGAGYYRCVVLHHPPIAGLTPVRRALRNDDALCDVLVRHGAELVLFGHNHVQSETRLQTSDGVCHVVGTPSASIGKAGRYDRARYNLFQIEGTTGNWQTFMQGRGLLLDDGDVVDLGRVKLISS